MGVILIMIQDASIVRIEQIAGQTSSQPYLPVTGGQLGSNTFSKGGYDIGDLMLDNGTTDTPGVLFYYSGHSNIGIDSFNNGTKQYFRITKNLNETGGSELAQVDLNGNIGLVGYLDPQKWKAGQVIQDKMLSNSEFTVNNTTVATSNTDTILATYSYTPVSNSSYLLIHFHCGRYDASNNGSNTGTDSWFSRILVDGAEISYAWQQTYTSNGGRSGALFPLIGRYTNSNTTAKSITIGVRRDSADDNIVVSNSSTSMWMRITEIAR